MTIAYPVPPRDAGSDEPASVRQFARRIADVVTSLMQGKMNNTTEVTLAASAGTTTITDARLTVQSVVHLEPLTANAAAEKGNGTLYISARNNGSVTLTHANNSQTDRTFAVSIVG
jgi:hypothetical protein